ncbi:MAG: hypothetical protein MI863_27925 [Desulfobacterales bacterium]|nr:hypothetical protein [Desulfobacterales bacterium]
MKAKSVAGTVLAFILMVSLVLPVNSMAAKKSGILTGVTTGKYKIGKDMPGAKKKAVNQALERAVQNAFASLVSRQVFASNLEFLYDRLLPGAADYVITYRVLDGIQHKGQYLVGVESKVDLALVEKRLRDARILNAGKDKPVVLFLIAEQSPADILPRYWWGNNPEPYTSRTETILKGELAQNRVLFAHTGQEYPDPSFYNIQFSSIYDADAAMDLGRALKADMVIMGKAMASESFNRMGDEKTFDAVIDLRGYDLASGKTVLQTSAKATATSVTDTEGAVQALTQAARTAGTELGQKIDTFWSQNLRKENSFDLAIEGDNFLPRFIALKKRIRDIRDIENMQPKEIGSAHAVMEIVYKGSPAQFADAVLLKTFEGYGLEIAEVSGELVKIRFVEHQEEAVQEITPADNPSEKNQE